MSEADNPFTNARRLEQVLEEGDGRMSGRLYTVGDMLEMMETAPVAAMDDPTTEAARVKEMFGLLAECALVRGPGERPKCMRCDDEFHRRFLPVAIGVVEPAVVRPRAGMVFGICRHCFGNGDVTEHMERFCQRLVETFGYDLEVLTTHGQVGHA